MKLIGGQPCRAKAADSACHCVMQLATLLCYAVQFGRIDGCQVVDGGGGLLTFATTSTLKRETGISIEALLPVL